MPLPGATLILPLELPSEAIDSVEVADVLSFEGEAAAGGDPWRNRGGYELVRRPEALEIRWLPARTVRCRLVVPGYQEAWSEPVQLEEGAEVTASPVRFSRGREIRLRLEAPEGSQVPREVSIRVWKSPEYREVRFASRRGDELGVWTLSAFGPGAYRLEVKTKGVYRTAKTTISVSEGDDADVEVVIPLAAR